MKVYCQDCQSYQYEVWYKLEPDVCRKFHCHLTDWSNPNEQYTCSSYRRVWWKFWAPNPTKLEQFLESL